MLAVRLRTSQRNTFTSLQCVSKHLGRLPFKLLTAETLASSSEFLTHALFHTHTHTFFTGSNTPSCVPSFKSRLLFNLEHANTKTCENQTHSLFSSSDWFSLSTFCTICCWAFAREQCQIIVALTATDLRSYRPRPKVDGSRSTFKRLRLNFDSSPL